METNGLLRQKMIKSLMAQNPEKVVDAAINLWEKMMNQIISIVGEGGFNSLYARSLFLTQSSFPWLPPPQAEHQFAQLKASFESQTPALASEANHLLLTTFNDILAILIGEELTISILRSAWGNDVSDSAGKEFENE